MIEKLSLEQQSTNYATMRHIERVRNLLNVCIIELMRRGELHDQSKLASPEVEVFTEYTPQLATSTFGSPEYNEYKQLMKPALDHHYAKNQHHPEHWVNGVDDMSLFDVMEMLIDWKAASERHNNGNIRRSIEINAKTYHLNPQLVRILENTVAALAWLE